jgi:hypothetical protein
MKAAGTILWHGREVPALPPDFEFAPADHRYKVDGAEKPGVTKILPTRFYGPNGSPAAAWGTARHEHVFHHINGTLDRSRIAASMKPIIEGFDRALAKLRIKIEPGKWLGEFFVISRRFGYCGRLDFLFDRGATDLLVDLKTGADGEVQKLDAAMQGGGYGNALIEMGLTTKARLRGATVFVGEDGGDTVDPYDMTNAIHIFMAQLTVRKYYREI